MAVKQAMRVLGFMSGTSLDAIDMAVLETDGETVRGFGPAGERKLSTATREIIEEATAAAWLWPPGEPEPSIFHEAALVIAAEHVEAAASFMAEHGAGAGDLDLIGFHGQTVLHQPPITGRPVGRTVQLGDAAVVARRLRLPVAYDFRTADVAAGGQGAPLAPIYHAARAAASGEPAPVAVLNLGGVANITLIPASGELEAFDSGPANGMIDLWVQGRTERRYDEDGALARAGRVHEDVVRAYLGHPYFSVRGPKSLDRFDFSFDAVEPLSLEDGAATLTAFTAASVALAVKACAEAPAALILTGGGRLNPVLVEAIRARTGIKVVGAEDLGWRGDAIEAEAFAYLAARTVKGLPISFPGTTGVPRPMTGGKVAYPS